MSCKQYNEQVKLQYTTSNEVTLNRTKKPLRIAVKFGKNELPLSIKRDSSCCLETSIGYSVGMAQATLSSR